MAAPFVGTKRGRQIVQVLRRLFLYSPERRAARTSAFIERKGGIEYYECQECKEIKERKETHVDHDPPVVDKTGITSWDVYIQRLFPSDPRALNVLCKACHRIKTNQENAGRREARQRKAPIKPSKPRINGSGGSSKRVRSQKELKG